MSTLNPFWYVTNMNSHTGLPVAGRLIAVSGGGSFAISRRFGRKVCKMHHHVVSAITIRLHGGRSSGIYANWINLNPSMDKKLNRL